MLNGGPSDGCQPMRSEAGCDAILCGIVAFCPMLGKDGRPFLPHNWRTHAPGLGDLLPAQIAPPLISALPRYDDQTLRFIKVEIEAQQNICKTQNEGPPQLHWW